MQSIHDNSNHGEVSTANPNQEAVQQIEPLQDQQPQTQNKVVEETTSSKEKKKKEEVKVQGICF